MICQKCGTQSKGRFCTYCGMPLYESEQKTPHVVEAPPKQEDKREDKKEAAPAAAPAAPRMRRVRFFRILPCILMLFLPLAYLFFDLYIRLPDALYATDAAGHTRLAMLFSAASSADYTFLSLQELTELVLGADVPLWRAITAGDLMCGGALGAAVWIVAVLSLLSAAFGVLLLLSFGRVLRSRLVTDMTLLVGLAAAFSPLMGLLWMRLSALGGGLAAADAAVAGTFLSVESAMLVGIAACFSVPALSVLRKEAARARTEQAYVPILYDLVGGRSFFLCRMLALLSIGLGVLLCAVMLFLPILTTGRLTELSSVKQSLISGLQGIAASLRAILASKGAEVDFSAMTALLLDSVYLLQLPILGMCAVGLVPAVLRVLFARKGHLAGHKGACRSLEKNGARVRRLLLAPFVCFMVAHMMLIALWLLCSTLVVRVDFGDVEGMLRLLYLTAGYVGTLSGTNTLYALLAFAGSLSWHAAGNFSAKLISLSHAECTK